MVDKQKNADCRTDRNGFLNEFTNYIIAITY